VNAELHRNRSSLVWGTFRLLIASAAHHTPDLDTTIVGTINPAHLQTNLDILQQGPLPQDLYEEAKQRVAAAGSAPQASGE
jgi:hypothetical protein